MSPASTSLEKEESEALTPTRTADTSPPVTHTHTHTHRQTHHVTESLHATHTPYAIIDRARLTAPSVACTRTHTRTRTTLKDLEEANDYPSLK